MYGIREKRGTCSMTVSFTLSVVSIIPQIGQLPLVGYLADTVVFMNSAEHNFMHKTDTNTSTHSSYVARCAVMGGRDYPNRVLVTT